LPRTNKPRERPKKKPRAEKAAVSSRSDQAEPDDHTEDAERPRDGAESGPVDGDDESRSEPDDAPADGDAYPDVADDAAAPVPHGRAARVTSEDSSMERFDPLSAYLREVQRHPLLAPEETQSLAEKFVKTQDSVAAARLVTSNLRLVVKIAYEYRRAYKNIMDLIQEGNIGLMQAVKRYDPYRGVKLSSYAAWWIRAYILRFILNNWRLVKLGTTQAQRKLFFNLRKKRAELQALGIDPTNA
jgi:RNA polymerase sigma-32 factor